MQSFYGGDPVAWFHTPIWVLTVYLKMLSPLKAEQQLRQIETVSVPHMKSDAVSRLLSRLTRRARRERPKSISEQLMASMRVVHTPVQPKE